MARSLADAVAARKTGESLVELVAEAPAEPTPTAAPEVATPVAPAAPAPRKRTTTAKSPAKSVTQQPAGPAAPAETQIARLLELDPERYLAEARADRLRHGSALNVHLPSYLLDALATYTGGSSVKTRKALIQALLHAYLVDAGILDWTPEDH